MAPNTRRATAAAVKSESAESQFLTNSIVHLLHRAYQYSADAFAEQVATARLTPRQLAVLCAVAASPGASQTAIVEATGIDRSTLADIVGRMIRKGLLKRVRSKVDARAYNVRLSPDGEQLLRSVMPAAAKADDIVLGVLSTPDQRHLVEGLSRLVAALSKPASVEA